MGRAIVRRRKATRRTRDWSSRSSHSDVVPAAARSWLSVGRRAPVEDHADQRGGQPSLNIASDDSTVARGGRPSRAERSDGARRRKHRRRRHLHLPTSLAAFGPISLVSMALTTIGALALAALFAALSRRMPAEGGPYQYARIAFGNRAGFATAWSYWITAWAGNAAIAVGWVLYVEVFVNTGHDKLWSIALVLAGLWVPALINLSGVRNVAAVEIAT